MGSARADPDFLAMQQAAGLAAALAGDPLPGEEGGQVESLTPEDGWQVPGEAAAEAAGSSSSSDSSGGGGGTSPGGRRLHQSGDAMLSAVLSAVGALQDSQAALEQQVTALQAAVQDAAAAARDAGVATLIATGQQQIVAGQAAIQGMLSEILGKQTAAAAAAAAQMQALANLQSLQQQQLAAQAALEQSAKDQAQAIAIALQQDMLTSRRGLRRGGWLSRQSSWSSCCILLHAGCRLGLAACPSPGTPPRTLTQPGAGAVPPRAPADAGGHQGRPAGLPALHRRHAGGARL